MPLAPHSATLLSLEVSVWTDGNPGSPSERGKVLCLSKPHWLHLQAPQPQPHKNWAGLGWIGLQEGLLEVVWLRK